MRNKLSEIVLSLLIMTLVLTVFGQFLKIEINLLNRSIPVYPSDITAIATFGLMLIAIRSQLRSIYKLPGIKAWIMWIGVAFLGWIIILPQVSLTEITVGGAYLARYIVYTGLLWPISVLLSSNQKFQLMNSIKWVLLFFAGSGLIMYLIKPDMRSFYYSGWDDHYYRLTGLFLDPGFTGLWISLGIIIWLNEYIRDSKNFLEHGLKTASLVLLIVSLALTFSRASYLSFIFGLLAWIIMKRKFVIGGSVLMSLLLAIILAPKPAGEGVNLVRTSTTNFRLINAQESLEVIAQSPWLGNGFNRIRFVKEKLNLLESNSKEHSGAGFDMSFLFLLATTGVVGTTIWLLYWWNLSREILNLDTESKSLMLSIFIAWFVHGLFHNTWFYTPNLLIFTLIGGVYLFPIIMVSKKPKAAVRSRFRRSRLT